MHFSFSTADLPANGKFETWRDLWMRRLVEVEVSTDIPDAFDGQIELWSAGPLSVAGVNVRKTLYDRTPSLARNGNDDFSLTLCGHDVAIRTPKGEEMHVRKRGAFFLRHDRRFSVEASDNCYTVLMRIDRKALLDLIPRGFDPDITGFAPGGPMVDLLWSYLPVITGEAGESARQSRDLLGRHVIDLIAMMLKPSRDAAELISGRGLKALRTKALLDAIDKHFATSDLSPATIARHLGISPRQVHRLLEETPKTFYEHVLERRLLGAHAMLTTPQRQERSIAEVALACGFADVTHFNRAFRARFGDTPTGVRGTASRDETMRVLRDSLAPKR